MAGVFTLISVIVILVVIVYGFGIGQDFFKDIQGAIKESQEQQKDATDPDLETTGNFAKDTNTRVCDLKITFVGILNDISHFGDPLNLANERFIEMGSHIKFLAFNFDERIIAYQWFCKDTASPFSTLAWTLGKAPSLSFGADKSQGETIRFKFIGESQTNGKLLFDKTGKGKQSNPFQASSRVSSGVDFPVSFTVPIYLEDVTEDDYIIEYWNDDYSVNGLPVGTQHTYKLCKPDTKC